jgi:DNA-binding CsgD family transcriptional regulator/PAS domain-containing protein
MAESDRLLETIERIHGAGLDGGRWQEALGAISGLFGSHAASLEVYRKQPFALIDFHTAGLPPQGQTDYLNQYAIDNPRADFAFRNFSKVTLCDYQLIDERTMDRDAFYTKYLRPLDLRYFLSGQIMDTPEIQGIVSIQRSRRQGHVEKRDIERMLRLLPHVRQAYDVASRLGRTEAAMHSLEDALDWLADGVAILDREGRVLHANAAFRAMVRRADGVRVVKRHIEFAAATARSQFATAVAAVARLHDGGHAVATDFRVDRGPEAPPYVVSVRPLVSVPPAPTGAAALAFFHDPLVSGERAYGVFRGLFDLTEAEARLARALQTGVSPVEYADRSGLSRNTVYTHLRRLKEKTRCTRLPELIRRLNDVQLAVRSS